MKTMNCYWFSLADNDSYAFRKGRELSESQKTHQEILPDLSGETRAGVRRCDACGELLAKWDEPLTGLVIRRRKLDISVTYDGVNVASRRFKNVYENNSLVGLTFRELPDDSDFYSIVPVRSVAFDAKRRKTRFEHQCNVCKRWVDVIGATPIYLKPGTAFGQRELVRTDLEFASGDEKGWLLLCGEAAANVLKSAKLKGVDLYPVDESVLADEGVVI